MTSLSFKLCLLLAFLSAILLPIAAFSTEETKVLSKIRVFNENTTFYGLIAASADVETAFWETAGFEPNTSSPYVDLVGRRFHIGTVEDRDVVFVRSGVGMVNAAVTTQLLLDYFRIAGVVHFGIAGNTNRSLQIGDVVVPLQFVHTGLWDWLNPNGNVPSNDVATLDIADYNEPKLWLVGSSNKLGKIAFSPEEFYSGYSAGNSEQQLWFPVNEYYLDIVNNELRGNTQLENCIDQSSCLNREPQIIVGQKGASSNVYIENAAYRKFLHDTFDVSSADMESSAVVMTCLSNLKRQVIVLRGLSNLAGEEGDNSFAKFRPLAAKNVVKVTVNLVKELAIQKHAEY